MRLRLQPRRERHGREAAAATRSVEAVQVSLPSSRNASSASCHSPVVYVNIVKAAEPRAPGTLWNPRQNGQQHVLYTIRSRSAEYPQLPTYILTDHRRLNMSIGQRTAGVRFPPSSRG